MSRVLPSSLFGRFVALSALWIMAALIGAWLLIGGILERFVIARIEAELSAMSDALLAGLEVAADGPALVAPPADPRFARPLSGWFWEIDPGVGAPLVSESLFLDELIPPFDTGPGGQRLMPLQRSATIPGWDRPIAIVVTAPQAELAAVLAGVRAPLFWSLAGLGAGLAGLALVQGGMALSGFRHIGAGIAAIRAGRSERLPRAGLAEVDAPVDEINSLLERNAAVMTRARNHVGNLAHALKTPLAALVNASDPGSDAARTAARMDRLIGYHLRRARGAGAARLLGARTPVLDVAEDIALVLRGLAAERGVTLRVEVPEALEFAGAREDLEEILGNLAENAVQWAKSRVEIGAHADGPDLRLVVGDDGPGIPPDRLADVLVRGGRLDESVAGSGLGLGIAADLVELNEGRLDFAPTSSGEGLHVEVRLPRAGA